MKETLLRSVFATVISIASASLLGRVLGLAGYGRYQLVLGLAAQVGQIFEAGLGTSVISLAPSGKNARQRAIRITAVFFLVVAVPAIVATAMLAGWLVEQASGRLLVSCCVISLTTVAQLLMVGLMRSFDRVRIANVGLLAVPMIHLLIAVSLWLTGSLDPINAVIAFATANVLTTLAGSWLLLRMASAGSANEQSLADASKRFGIKLLLQTGWRSSVARISQLMIYRLDLFILAFFWGETSVGIYAPAIFLVSQLNQLGDSVSFVLYPSVARGRSDHLETCQSCRGVVWVTVVAALCLGTLAPVVLTVVWGSEFQKAMLPLLVLLPGYVALTPSRVLASYLAVRTQFRSPLKASLWGLAINSILNLMLIPSYGVVGAALATSIALLLVSVLIWRDFVLLTNVSWRECWLPRWFEIKNAVARVRFARGATMASDETSSKLEQY